MLASTVKPVLRGHPREGQKWLYKIGYPLIQFYLHYVLVQGAEKLWLLKTGDPLIEVSRGDHMSRFDCK